jgi:hypothetical protein
MKLRQLGLGHRLWAQHVARSPCSLLKDPRFEILARKLAVSLLADRKPGRYVQVVAVGRNAAGAKWPGAALGRLLGSARLATLLSRHDE